MLAWAVLVLVGLAAHRATTLGAAPANRLFVPIAALDATPTPAALYLAHRTTFSPDGVPVAEHTAATRLAMLQPGESSTVDTAPSVYPLVPAGWSRYEVGIRSVPLPRSPSVGERRYKHDGFRVLGTTLTHKGDYLVVTGQLLWTGPTFQGRSYLDYGLARASDGALIASHRADVVPVGQAQYVVQGGAAPFTAMLEYRMSLVPEGYCDHGGYANFLCP
jgi:hypothetical protein